MQTFVQEPNPSQERARVSLARSNPARFDLNHKTDPIPHTHSAIESQAPEGMSLTSAEQLVAGPGTAMSGFGFEFSTVPVISSRAREPQFDFTRVPAATLPVQRKPAISSPSDAYEREADEVADKVTRAAQLSPISTTREAINRKCAQCEDEDEKRIQTKRASAPHTDEILEADAAVSAIERGGTPLPGEVRSYFEPRFGYDFSRVRVHADTEASDGARAVGARAYTIGGHIAFAAGEYSPATVPGKRLLAHELTHVVQQGQAYPLDDVGFQKQRAQVALSTRSIAESPAVISRQKTNSRETSGKQSGTGRTLEERRKLLQTPCLGEPVDDKRARCQFTSRQETMVRLVKQSALRTCTKAIAAIDMPGNEDWVVQIAKYYFHLNIKLTEKTKRTLIGKIKSIGDKLEQAPLKCGTCQDENCNSGFVAFADGRTDLVLCPPFFHSEIHSVGSTPVFLLHEAGHLAGINKPTRDELYCHQGERTEEDKCPVVDAFHNADAWAHFIDALAASL